MWREFATHPGDMKSKESKKTRQFVISWHFHVVKSKKENSYCMNSYCMNSYCMNSYCMNNSLQ
jgi:hypothetical protein